jgi:uncharacterized protein YbjT (DUF2867 family)
LESWQAPRTLPDIACIRTDPCQEKTMYAVAGVTGQTGAAVARALLEAGAPVRVVVRRPDAGAQWRALGAEVAVADLADAGALARALAGTQGAYLLNPPRYDVADPFTEAQRVGAAFAEAIAAVRVPRVVVLSSVGAHQPAGTGIIGTTRRIEQALAAVAAPIVFLRANYFFENWANVLPAARGDGVLPAFLAPADRRVPMVPVADIAAAVVALLRGPAWTGHRVVELASFDASPADVAAALGGALGKPVAAVGVPHAQWKGILQGAGFRAEIADEFVAMYDGINGGVVAAQPGTERIRGGASLPDAVRALVG